MNTKFSFLPLAASAFIVSAWFVAGCATPSESVDKDASKTVAPAAVAKTSVPAYIDFETADKVFQKIGRDRKRPIAEVSNAFVRVLSATNITDATRASALADFGRYHIDRSLLEPGIACFESVYANKNAEPKTRVRAMNEAGKALSWENFRGAFASYRHDNLDRAAKAFLRIPEIEGATGPEKVEAYKSAAKALLDAAQEVVPEAEELFVKATKLPELDEQDRARAEMNLVDYYIESLAPEKARPILARLAPQAKEKQYHIHLRGRIFGTYARLIADLDGFDKALPMVTDGILKEAFDTRSLARFCSDHGRDDLAVKALRQGIPGADAKPHDRIRYISWRLSDFYAPKGLKAYREFFEKDLLPLLKKNPDEWKQILSNLNSQGFRYSNTAKTPGYDDWLLSIAVQAPAGKGLSDSDLFEIACRCGNADKTTAFARALIKADDAKDKNYVKAGLALAVIEAHNSKIAVQKVQAWLDKAPVKKAKARGEAMLEAARIAMGFRHDQSARALYDAYGEMIVQVKKPTIDCPFVPNAPQEISQIMASDFYKNAPKGKLDKKYGEHLQFLLDTDAAVTGRKIVEGKDGVPVPDLFAFCDVHGVKFLINAYMAKDEIEKFKSGFGGVPSYEAYLAAGADAPYDFLYLEPVSPYTDEDGGFVTQYDNGNGYRNLSVSKGTIAVRYLVRDDSVVTMVAVSWKAYFNNLPVDGTAWYFEPIIWMRGGLSWGGSESVHHRSSYGRVVFKNLTPENLTAIKRHLLGDAVGCYRRAKAARSNGQIEIWKDSELGDQDFYDECVEPLSKRLDPYERMVEAEMSDEDVDLVYDNAARTWFNIDYVIWQMRRDYLDAKLVQGEE